MKQIIIDKYCYELAKEIKRLRKHYAIEGLVRLANTPWDDKEDLEICKGMKIEVARRIDTLSIYHSIGLVDQEEYEARMSHLQSMYSYIGLRVQSYME